MTKQEEIVKGIDEEVALELCLYCQKHDQSGDPCTVEQPCEATLVTAKTIRGIYHSQGVVIKVDVSDYIPDKCAVNLVEGRGYPRCGYEATVPLIKEV